MIFKHISPKGTVTESESLTSMLRGMNIICTPDLDNRLKSLTCPKHGTKLGALTISHRELSMISLML